MIAKKIGGVQLVVMYATFVWFIFSTLAIGGETTLEYDDFGRLIFVSESTNYGTSKVEYTYDDAGNRTARIVPYGVSITCNENGTSSHNGPLSIQEGEILEVI